VNRFPLFCFAAKCREDAIRLRVAAAVADQSAARLETIGCYGTDEEVTEALKLVGDDYEPADTRSEN
jgi:hypothetical protein